LSGIGEPVADHVVVELLRPEHSRERLAHHVSRVVSEASGDDRRVELVRLALAQGDDLGGPIEGTAALPRNPQVHRLALSGADLEPVMRRALRAAQLRVHRG
jgi:hypothetical protein